MLNKYTINNRYTKVEKFIIRRNKTRVFSTLNYHKSKFWDEFCTTVDVAALTGIRRILKIVMIGLQSYRYDRFFVTGGERTDLLALTILALFPWVSKKFVIVDAHWQKKTGLLGLMQNIILLLSKRIVCQVQVHSNEEKELYPSLFPVNKDIIKAIPFSTSIMGYDINISNENFILSGGGSFRNYQPILDLDGKLPMQVKLGIPKSFLKFFPYIDNNYTQINIVNNWSNNEYFYEMSKCDIFLMPLESGMNRTAGDQTILNAMFMRKLVVISDSITARSYIQHGVNGFIYEEDDANSLLSVIADWKNLNEKDKEVLLDKAEFDANTKYSEKRRLLKTALTGISD